MTEIRHRAGSRKNRLRMIIGLATAFAVATTLTVGLTSTASAGKSFKATHNPPYTFVFSNNFLGNDWRPQIEKLAVLTAKLPPFAGKVHMKIVNSQSTNQAQIADLNSIIQTKPDVILLIPGSDTALDPAIKRACDAGILVFTLSAPVKESCAWNLNEDHYLGNSGAGQWMAKALHGTGSVFSDQGIPGLGVSKDIQTGFLAGLHKFGPNIKVVGQFASNYGLGPAQSGISSLLVAHPDVSGVAVQGYCTPSFNAFKQAGKPAVPTTCYAYNGEMTACAQSGHACALLSNSPAQVQVAMKLALDILQGKPAPPRGPAKKNWISYPMYLYVSASPKVTVNVPGLKVEVLKKGVNFFPNLPAGIAPPFTLPQYHITARQVAAK